MACTGRWWTPEERIYKRLVLSASFCTRCSFYLPSINTFAPLFRAATHFTPAASFQSSVSRLTMALINRKHIKTKHLLFWESGGRGEFSDFFFCLSNACKRRESRGSRVQDFIQRREINLACRLLFPTGSRTISKNINWLISPREKSYPIEILWKYLNIVFPAV